ncbi:MAG: hypothetical protein CBC23_009290 [Rhodospirillaceae bacterium TMED63]|nr:MAG: hypothetical protein CBC23_009290 [Rhodospirillaceae bacterium TMED63]
MTVPRHHAGELRSGTSKRVRCIETGEVYRSATAAARAMKADNIDSYAARIGIVCRDEYKRKNAYGYHWEYDAPIPNKARPNRTRLTGRIKSIDTAFRNAREAIGRPDLRIHDLRHSLGTWLSMSGANLMVVKEILGHEDIRTTQRYVHIDEKATRAALETVKLPKLNAA